MIRYKCDDCGSVLTIKDALAGTPGKCPKCKKKFIVPDADTASPPESPQTDRPSPKAPAKLQKRPPFDPADMGDDEPLPVAPKRPVRTKLGGRGVDPADLPENSSVAPVAKRGPAATKLAARPPADPADEDDDPFGPPVKLGAKPPVAPAKKTGGPPAKSPPKVKETFPTDEDAYPEDEDEAPQKLAPPAAKSKKSGGDDFDPADFLMETNEAAKAKKVEAVEEWDGSGFPPAPKPSAPKNLARFLKKTAGVADEPEPETRAPGDPPMVRHRVDAKATGSAADTANDMINVASSNAKDALTKTAEQSRLRASQMPEKQSRFDTDAFIYFLKTQVGPLVLAFVVILGMSYGMYRYISTNDLPMPPLGMVKGTVKIDGQPASGVRIQFIPVNPDMKSKTGKTLRARASSAITNDKGEYVLHYIDNFPGAAVGKHSVEITYTSRDGRILTAPNYGPGSNKTEEVAAGEKTIDFQWNAPAVDQ